jgi:glycosyltransferase involved in cell wall biosynthesis
MRLGVYIELKYTADNRGVFADQAFILFVCGLAQHVDQLVLFGRLGPEASEAPYRIPEDVRFVPLPYYARTSDPAGVLRALRSAREVFESELPHLDAVWLFGPHPVANAFARLALRRGKQVFLGVRQDFPRYVRSRQTFRMRLWSGPAAHLLERQFRRLARAAPAVVVGDELGATYRKAGGQVLVSSFSLISRADLVPLGEALARTWRGEIRLLSVGRLDAEKNPLLLPEILAGLRARAPWRLVVAGSGPLEDDVAKQAAELGVSDALDLLGYVPFGPRLAELYRSSHAFVHVSLTEGLPQVLVEAQAAGLPIVATDVGGVRAALRGGTDGLLIPPGAARPAVEALERLRLDPELRRSLVERGLARAAGDTTEIQVQRVAEFFTRTLRR